MNIAEFMQGMAKYVADVASGKYPDTIALPAELVKCIRMGEAEDERKAKEEVQLLKDSIEAIRAKLDAGDADRYREMVCLLDACDFPWRDKGSPYPHQLCQLISKYKEALRQLSRVRNAIDSVTILDSGASVAGVVSSLVEEPATERRF